MHDRLLVGGLAAIGIAAMPPYSEESDPLWLHNPYHFSYSVALVRKPEVPRESRQADS